MGNYIPGTKQEQKEMLAEIGFESMEDLFGHIPDEVKVKDGLHIPEGMSELEVRRKMSQIAAKNKVFPVIFRGAGAYRHYIPSVVKSVISKENLVTAYTPYQAEISQGILQSIFEYQTMICELTGMDVSNASVYDGGSAAAEAVAMCRERKRSKALIAATVDPHVLETVKTYCYGNEMELDVIPEKDGAVDLEALRALVDSGTACVYIQQPNYYGSLEDAEAIGEVAHEAGAKYIMGVNPISLGIIKTPREYGADVAVGDGQPLGLSLAFGGPYLGFMACVSGMTRKLPGRIVGQTKDHNGKTGYVLTLQAREQHIRREKASSNVCSNQALCALAVGVYLASMGSEGLKNVAVQCTSKAHYMARELEKAGCRVENQGEFFHEFVTVSDAPAESILSALEKEGILGGYPLDEHRILWCCTEMNSKEDIDRAVAIVKGV
ncbi:aminomethyl-transferring glycine dehydrogenase subunit GcvPA [Dorea acetigenes]|uniref:Probable glycine dehydrogenase (decarboxylating) subunit 1 n=1 Tax=Dorea acetigenes TaxID=2981787 RepID=A0ABT2RKH3_9FIRM|nr:aminomethyl-transferring glycine dehydrogenase subunit GcvPA [Dorea acetigenes]MCB6414918.1 aminomethyl-transferring glycine dehydrogenase subunit GcvPA [Faecalimonas umbilicata]MCU6685913.1 aminomethyl-transferring glycine dehydrogenase subunit GcvPA [Dorea acetigenes]SCI70187.1 Probable glycine dehydrogenase [decarboxylating] subunit 1 [uncultured Clostridium sp.]